MPASRRIPRSASQQQLREILVVLVLGLPLIVALAGVGGYVLARRALAPIDHLAAEARRITADRLHERLSVPNAAGRNRPAGRGHQRHVRAPGIVVRSAAAIHRRCVARAADAAGRHSRHRGDGPARDAHARRIQGCDRQHARRGRSPDPSGRHAAAAVAWRRRHGPSVARRRSTSAISRATSRRRSASSRRSGSSGSRSRADANVRVSADRLVLRDAITNVVDNAIKYGPRASTIDDAGRRRIASRRR